ncbi:DUF222 domain-containing protein [Sphaerimonospora sp. CA-214678]|uniref:HNH endonuclease signature motif containing protein n=1 Tax=Sphaerimonospora sp. CA-214678 TaxID=3240029 RepID=UPI003D8F5BE6
MGDGGAAGSTDAVGAVDVDGVLSWPLVSQVREAALAVAVTPVPEAAEVCLAQLEELAFARDRLEAAIALRAGRVHAAGAARQAGHASTRTWLRSVCGMSRRAAHRTVALGVELERLPEVRARFAAGNLAEAVVSAICAATTGLSDADAVKAETILLELADSAGPQEIAKAGRYLRAVLDPDGELRDAGADDDARFLLVRETDAGGVEGEFRLPREAAARLRALLDAYARPKAQGDDRPLRVRNADALIALLEQQITTELLVLINAESLPDDPTPHGTTPNESTPSDTPPEDRSSDGTAPDDARLGDTAFDDAQPGDAAPGDTVPGDTVSENAAPGDATPGDTVRSDGPARATGPETREDPGGDPGPDHTPDPAPEPSPEPALESAPEPASGFISGALPGTGHGNGKRDTAPGDDPPCGQDPGQPTERSAEPRRTSVHPAPRSGDKPSAVTETGSTDQPATENHTEIRTGTRTGTRTRIDRWAGEDDDIANTTPTGAAVDSHRTNPITEDPGSGDPPKSGTGRGDPTTGDLNSGNPRGNGPSRGDPTTGGPGRVDPHEGDPHEGDPRGGMGAGGRGTGNVDAGGANTGGGSEDTGCEAGDRRWLSVLRTLPGLLLSTGHLLPITDIHRLARTSTLVRLVMNADGQVLDMGRKTRLATPAQRRAIAARYDTCWVKGCPLPASMCQIDHLDNWSEGGHTDLARLGPACQFHNRDRYLHPDRYQRRQIGPDRWEFTYIGPSPTRKHRREPTQPTLASAWSSSPTAMPARPAEPVPGQCHP